MGILDKLAHQFKRLDSLTFRFQHDWFSDEGRWLVNEESGHRVDSALLQWQSYLLGRCPFDSSPKWIGYRNLEEQSSRAKWICSSMHSKMILYIRFKLAFKAIQVHKPPRTRFQPYQIIPWWTLAASDLHAALFHLLQQGQGKAPVLSAAECWHEHVRM